VNCEKEWSSLPCNLGIICNLEGRKNLKSVGIRKGAVTTRRTVALVHETNMGEKNICFFLPVNQQHRGGLAKKCFGGGGLGEGQK